MATVSHTIYSRYDPPERGSLEQSAGQSSDTLDLDDTWQHEANLASRRRHRPPPHFIPASVPSTESGPTRAGSSHVLDHSDVSLGTELSSWYQSLSSSRDPGNSTTQSSRSTVPAITRNNSSPSLGKAPISEKKNKNNWFIMKAIQSEPSSTHPSPPPSLADILARDPPPLPTEEKYKPPVWLELGPSNKGFAMLQRSGWNEGEALGPHVIRRPSESPLLDKKGKRREDNVTHEVLEFKSEEHDDVSELREVAVIDLSLSDSDPDTDDPNPNTGNFVSEKEHSPENLRSAHVSSSAHGGTALLTPLVTVLKSDRLGIGLKAKTVGPYKASKKRVTHNSVAMAAHIRTTEAIRRQKKEYGRGRRGYDKLRKREEAERKALLAHIKH